MGSALGCRRSDQNVIKMVGMTLELRSPAGQSLAKPACKKEEKLKPMKGAPQQQQKTNKEPTAKMSRKKKRTSTEPRKGRKESFTKYMPDYVPPNVPGEVSSSEEVAVFVFDEKLGGLCDAVEYEDPYTIAREKLLNPRKRVIPPPTEPVPTQLCHSRGIPPQLTCHCHCHCALIVQANNNQHNGMNDNLYLDSLYNENHNGVERHLHHEAGCDAGGRYDCGAGGDVEDASGIH